MHGLSFDLLDPENETKTFEDLMKVREIHMPHTPPNCRVFQSTMVPFQPLAAPGVFGGHVLGQSAYAGSKTVGPTYICHNTHGLFLLPGKNSVPFIYLVESLRTGKSYSTRCIKVYQIEKHEVEAFRFDDKYLCFISIGSYKAPELNAALKHQLNLDPQLNLSHDDIEKLPWAPDVDTPMWIKYAEQNNLQPEVHPIEARKMDTSEYNKNRKVSDRRIMNFFKSHHPLSADPNLHIAALLYMSDRNSLFTIVNVMDEEFMIKQIASIDHSFVCHNLDPRVDLDWLAMETYTTRAFDNRGLYQGRIYDSNNRLICSFMQDGVLRLIKNSSL